MKPMIRPKSIIPAFLALWLGCVALLPKAAAVVPPPDGGYPGFNTAEGQNALFSLTTGAGNAAVGWFSLFSNTDGSFNTALGAGALLFNIGDQGTGEGTQNTAIGTAALLNNTTGFNNTASGVLALSSNTTGNSNTATGASALADNTTGQFNTAYGAGTLLNNTAGGNNTAIGTFALQENTFGGNNIAIGYQALPSNTTGGFNTANGVNALSNNTTGDYNTAIGYHALFGNNTGSDNIALGQLAGVNVNSVNNVIAIGSAGENVGGRCYIGNIRGLVVGNGDGINVIVDSDGQLGTSNSSRRFKKDIKPMERASEAILALKPVTFHYKNQDTKEAQDTPQFGLIAEDVADVNPALVVCDANGESLAVRYDAVNAMLLNEFLKEHRKNDEQALSIARLEQQIEALAAGLQKVSAQLATARPSLANLK